MAINLNTWKLEPNKPEEVEELVRSYEMMLSFSCFDLIDRYRNANGQSTYEGLMMIRDMLLNYPSKEITYFEFMKETGKIWEKVDELHGA